MSQMKWPLAGYAPGRYTCVCQVCGDQFEGDKRAYQCLACATKSIVNSHASLVEENKRMREALEEVATGEWYNVHWVRYMAAEVLGEPVKTFGDTNA